MKDPRIAKLARNLVRYSCRVQPGDKVLIENTGLERELVEALVRETYDAGALPFVWIKENSVQRQLMLGLKPEQADIMAENEAALMRQMNAYIGVRSGDNAYQLSDVPAQQLKLYSSRVSHPVHSLIRVPDTRWVVLRYPCPAMAQQAAMSTEAFEDYYFDVCCLDYGKMDRAMQPLAELMGRTNDVRIVGPGTDLTFSIAGMHAIPCSGQMNIPDGEIYTAPVRESVNGVITYNTPSLYQGTSFENVCLHFAGGKIVEATANYTDQLNAILDTDEGARYVGEFALGVNPYITKAMKDTLFDEKIAGSFHFTPGNCYDECPNGNKSAIHWDMVLIQTPEYGGGEIYFDGVLVRKDGRFTLPELEPLNPENLK